MSSNSASTLKKPEFVKIETIDPHSHSLNVLVKVIENEVILDKERSDGSRARASEALVGDDSGTIIFSAWGDQIDLLKEGTVLEILNARIEMFDRKYMRLKAGKWSSIVKSNKKVENVKKDNNVSLTEYMAEKAAPQENKK